MTNVHCFQGRGHISIIAQIGRKFVPTSFWCDLSPVEWLLRKMNENLFMQTATWLTSRTLARSRWNVGHKVTER